MATNAERQAAFRKRQAEQLATEVRGIFAHKDDHAAIKNYAAKLAKKRARRLTSELSGIRRNYGEAPLERWVMPLETTEKEMSKHLELVRAVNSSTTEREHDLAEARLQGWREGVEHCGRKWDYIAADEDAETIYPGRPYCCGVLLDWTPAPKFANVFCSQCGQEFGPGDHGFSHCANHKRHNV